MSAPKRIQRKRTKGWRMPEGAVYVGRPSKWGNPYRVKQERGLWVVQSSFQDHILGVHNSRYAANRQAVEVYALQTGPLGAHELDMDEVRNELTGRDLVCWCVPTHPCHADVLLRIAAGEEV